MPRAHLMYRPCRLDRRARLSALSAELARCWGLIPAAQQDAILGLLRLAVLHYTRRSAA